MWRAKMSNRNGSQNSREKRMRLPSAGNFKEKIRGLLPNRGVTIYKEQNSDKRAFLYWDELLLVILMLLSVAGVMSIWGAFLL